MAHYVCFDLSVLILMEYQPPGFSSIVENCIMSKYRSKVQTIMPRTMHKCLGISHLSKPERILWAIVVAHEYGVPLPQNEPQHNADTFLFLLYWMQVNRTSRHFPDLQPATLVDESAYVRCTRKRRDSYQISRIQCRASN